MQITFASMAAWRALYIARANTSDGYGRHQFFHIGIDPNDGIRPTLFGGFVNPWNRRGFSFRWRVPLPHVKWKNGGGSRFHLFLYGISHKFWHKMDGRFGWGTGVPTWKAQR
jgi:hypothetical protein